MRGESLNGTGALAELFRQEGHTVRAAVRLTDDLGEWADVIVRFAQTPGPPGREEAGWYAGWLDRGQGSGLIYVPRDYDAQAEYWQGVLAAMPKTADASLRARVEKRLEAAKPWSAKLPPEGQGTRRSRRMVHGEPLAGLAGVCKTLGGPWSEGIDPVQASLTRHETLDAASEEEILLEGDGKTLAMEWQRSNDARVLVVANGSFLLNATLVNRARRPLALARGALGGRRADECGVRRGIVRPGRSAGATVGLRAAEDPPLRLAGRATAGPGARGLPGEGPASGPPSSRSPLRRRPPRRAPRGPGRLVGTHRRGRGRPLRLADLSTLAPSREAWRTATGASSSSEREPLTRPPGTLSRGERKRRPDTARRSTIRPNF